MRHLLFLLTLGLSTLSAVAQANGFVQKKFDQLDRNGDGTISAEELGKPVAFRKFDANQSGGITLDEFKLALEFVMGNRTPTESAQPWSAAPFLAEIPEEAPISKATVLAAAEYSASMKGISFLVFYDGTLLYEDYPNGGAPDRAQELASGTKSFSGVLACAAVEDGLLTFDELACDTLTEWKEDPKKSKITVRHLLNLTSGLEPESLSDRQVPSYQEAIHYPILHEPGTTYDYGPVEFQCFGELLRRKLVEAGHDESPLDYLKRRIFDPIGLEYDRWRHDQNDQPHLPSGAPLTARNWAKFGELVRLKGRHSDEAVIPSDLLDECFVGTPANPAYGLTFWLNEAVETELRNSIKQLRFATDDLTVDPNIPSDLVMAAGAGKQRLYVSREAKLVIVRQASGIMDALSGQMGSFSDLEFLQHLMKD